MIINTLPSDEKKAEKQKVINAFPGIEVPEFYLVKLQEPPPVISSTNWCIYSKEFNKGSNEN